jgi:hypothetical protein
MTSNHRKQAPRTKAFLSSLYICKYKNKHEQKELDAEYKHEQKELDAEYKHDQNELDAG